MSTVTPIAKRIIANIEKVVIGKRQEVILSLVAYFSEGHILLEDVPGVAKTMLARSLANSIGGIFKRVQCTPDLLPNDITGASVFNPKTTEFEFRPGPLFAQIVLADEINRTTPRTQAALLEAMAERCVTVDGETYLLDPPFLVMATQNPIESEGTYNLPEAQLDRFMFKLVIDYPSAAQEADILAMHSVQIELDRRLDELQPITSPEEIIQITRAGSDVRVDPKLLDYINTLVRLTREWPQFHLGASPRAGLALMQGARTLASFHGRDYAVPDDVVELAMPVLRHRVILSAEAEVEGHSVDELLGDLIKSVEVPRL